MEELALFTIPHAFSLSFYSTERYCVKGRGLKDSTKSPPPMVGQTPPPTPRPQNNLKTFTMLYAIRAHPWLRL